MASNNLTKRQNQVLDFIVSQIQRKGYPPSVREIGQAIGLSSSSTVHSHLRALERKGYLRRDPTKPRALEIFGFRPSEIGVSIDKIKNVPLVGRVAAGTPLLAEENIEDTVPLPVDLVGDSQTFLLRVKGESMIEAGILDGDHIVVRQQSYAQDGDIVVALLEDEATVKRLRRRGDKVILEPANRSMVPIIAKDITVLGKVIGLYRNL